MSSRLATCFATPLMLCLGLVGANSARAAWPTDPLVNVPVCTSPGDQTKPLTESVPDGAGGIILAWKDRRGANLDIYAQHVLASGVVDPAWPANVDKLDGVVAPDFYESKASLWRARQDRIRAELETLQAADRETSERGLQLFELTQQAHGLYEKQGVAEKRELLRFLVSNSSWKHGELTVKYRQPFDILLDETSGDEASQVDSGVPQGDFEKWRPQPGQLGIKSRPG